jgi:hypothetical protein
VVIHASLCAACELSPAIWSDQGSLIRMGLGVQDDPPRRPVSRPRLVILQIKLSTTTPRGSAEPESDHRDNPTGTRFHWQFQRSAHWQHESEGHTEVSVLLVNRTAGSIMLLAQ